MKTSDAIRDCCRGSTLLVGLGNPMFGDDGCGVRLAEMIERCGTSGPSPLAVVVAGTSPERCLDACRERDTVIFADAVEGGLDPGTVILMDAEQIASRYPQVSTHKLSLGLLARLLAAEGVRTWLLGIQPGSMAAGAGLTREVAESVEGLARALQDAVSEVGA